MMLRGALQVGDVLVQKLLLFDGAASQFRMVKLRPRNPACKACGDSPSITAGSLAAYDYTAFTGQAADDKGAACCQPLRMSWSQPCSLTCQTKIVHLWDRAAQVQCLPANCTLMQM